MLSVRSFAFHIKVKIPRRLMYNELLSFKIEHSRKLFEANNVNFVELDFIGRIRYIIIKN